MKKVLATGIILGIAAALSIAAYVTLFCSPVTSSSTTPASSVVNTMKSGAGNVSAAAANAAIDASGIKSKVNSALQSNSATIAAATGLSQTQVDTAISNLNIENWKATTLPANAAAEDSYPINYNGTSATVTTYADPSYVTVNSAGQSLTLSVPESAQGSIDYLAYLN